MSCRDEVLILVVRLGGCGVACLGGGHTLSGTAVRGGHDTGQGCVLEVPRIGRVVMFGVENSGHENVETACCYRPSRELVSI